MSRVVGSAMYTRTSSAQYCDLTRALADGGVGTCTYISARAALVVSLFLRLTPTGLGPGTLQQLFRQQWVGQMVDGD